MFPVIIAGLRLIRPGFVNVFVSDFYCGVSGINLKTLNSLLPRYSDSKIN